jgi:hypothetical protein
MSIFEDTTVVSIRIFDLANDSIILNMDATVYPSYKVNDLLITEAQSDDERISVRKYRIDSISHTIRWTLGYPYPYLKLFIGVREEPYEGE